MMNITANTAIEGWTNCRSPEDEPVEKMIQVSQLQVRCLQFNIDVITVTILKRLAV